MVYNFRTVDGNSISYDGGDFGILFIFTSPHVIIQGNGTGPKMWEVLISILINNIWIVGLEKVYLFLSQTRALLLRAFY